MKIYVDRFIEDAYTTVSKVIINDALECFGLEDGFRGVKVPGETRIPVGIYKIGVRKVGGFHNRYSKRFPSIHKGMLHILNVPGFEYILIHCGNDNKDTAGCLLLGSEASLQTDGMRILNSVSAYKSFYKKVIDHALKGEVTICFNNLI